MKIWFDCDPGIDDSIALGLALANSDKFDIIGISGVGGNANVDQVTENLVRLVSLLNRKDIPIYKGAAKPLARPLRDAVAVHGSTGLGFAVLPETDKVAEKENTIVAMYNAIKNCSEKVTLIPTGPLTNIALLLSTFPDVTENIEQIILMGGAAVGGNATPYAEFNIYTDEVASKMVFDSGVKLIMCGLDVTMKCGIHENENNKLVNSDNFIHKSFGLMMKHYIDRRVYGEARIAYLHDAVTFMYLLHPEIFDGFYATVNVPIGEVERRGQTQTTPCDKDDPHACLVLNQADSELFTKYLLDSLYSY